MKYSENNLNISEFLKFCIDFKVLVKKSNLIGLYKMTTQYRSIMKFEEFLIIIPKLSIAVNEEKIYNIKSRIKLCQFRLNELIEEEKLNIKLDKERIDKIIDIKDTKFFNIDDIKIKNIGNFSYRNLCFIIDENNSSNEIRFFGNSKYDKKHDFTMNEEYKTQYGNKKKDKEESKQNDDDVNDDNDDDNDNDIKESDMESLRISIGKKRKKK